MTAPSETFDLPPELRARANEITGKYRMALAVQMAEEMVDAGVPMNLAFQITVGELAVSAARVAMMACVGLEKREPRRDLWMKRAEENFDEAREWFANLQTEGRIDRCPICAEPFKADDVCATDIELMTCHAACLEGSPVVDLDSGEPLPEGKMHTHRYGDDTPSPQVNVDGPTYLDFITPDDVFDKGPDAVKSWQEAKSAEITNPPPQQHVQGKEPPLDWGNFEGPKLNVEWKPEDQDLIYTAINFRDDEYGDKDEDAGQQIVERLLAAWKSTAISEQITFENAVRLLKERDELRAGIKRLSDEEELCAEVTGDDPFSVAYLAAKLQASDVELDSRTKELDQTLADLRALRVAAQEVIASASDTYKKRNGHLASFEDDSGEKCWIVPFDALEGLRSAVAALALEEPAECSACGGTGRMGPFFPGGMSTACGNCQTPPPQPREAGR